MKQITIWHNPRCSKSREALSILEESGCEKEIIKYLEETPDKNRIKTILKMLNISARDLMRKQEAIYKELKLKEVDDEEKLIAAMAENPKLIERPIIIKDNKAIIGRPPSLVNDFIK